jgi:hypothetical protein
MPLKCQKREIRLEVCGKGWSLKRVAQSLKRNAEQNAKAASDIAGNVRKVLTTLKDTVQTFEIGYLNRAFQQPSSCDKSRFESGKE